MENIITMIPISQNVTTFQDPRLTKHTERIVKIYTDAAVFADKKNREIASILATIKSEKSYEKDGFSSVAEYAEKVFGIRKNNAYALATAGEIYNNPETSPALKQMSPSKVVELSRIPVDKIEESIKDGKISSASSQKELREFAKEYAKSERPTKSEMLVRYTAHPVSDTVPALNKVFSEPHTIDEFDEIVTNFIQENNLSVLPVEIVKLPKGTHRDRLDAEKKTIQRRLYITEAFSLVLEFYELKPPKTSKAPSKVTKFTREELVAMLKQMDEVGSTDYIDKIEP